MVTAGQILTLVFRSHLLAGKLVSRPVQTDDSAMCVFHNWATEIWLARVVSIFAIHKKCTNPDMTVERLVTDR